MFIKVASSIQYKYWMRRGNISGTREIRKQLKYIDAGGSKSTRALTRDQQYILFRLKQNLLCPTVLIQL